MNKKVKSIELRKESSSNGQFYEGTTIRKEYDDNNLLIKESIFYEEAQNNGCTDTSNIKYYNKGKILKEIITDFSTKLQLHYKYYDNIELIETRIILDDKRDVIDRLNEYYIEEIQNTITNEDNNELKEIRSKYNLINELVSKKTKYLNVNGDVEKVIFEDFKNSSNNTITEISYNDTSLEFDNNGLFITEVTYKNGSLLSKKNSHIYHKKSETISYFEGKNVVQKFEHSISFKECKKNFTILLKFSRSNNDSFQVDYINVTIESVEDEKSFRRVNLDLDYKNQFEKGTVFKNIGDICLFQVFDSTKLIFEKLESFFTKNALFNFYYEKSNNFRVLEEIEIFTNYKDSLSNLHDIIPGSLEFENFIQGGSYFNYIEVPYSPNNQEYYIRVFNSHKCGYLKIEYY